MKAAFVALLVVLVLGNRSRLLQETQCHTVTKGKCYEEVDWAMKTGIHRAPQWYPGLDTTSSWEEFQQYFHERPNMGGKGNDCPMPCPNHGCLTIENQQYNPIDYGSNGRSVEQNAADCAKRCLETEHCIGSSWWSDGGCHLATYGAVLTSSGGVTASKCFDTDVPTMSPTFNPTFSPTLDPAANPSDHPKDGFQKMTHLGVGYCTSGFYAGWDGQGIDSQEACNQVCLMEQQCTYAAFFAGKTCSRYDGNSCTLNSDKNHITYAKQSLKVQWEPLFTNVHTTCDGNLIDTIHEADTEILCKSACVANTECSAVFHITDSAISNRCLLYAECDKTRPTTYSGDTYRLTDSENDGLLNEGEHCWVPCESRGLCAFCGTGACCSKDDWYRGVPGCELAEHQRHPVCGDFSAPYPEPAEFRLGMPLGTAKTPKTFPDVETQGWIGDITGEEDDTDNVPEYDGLGGAPWSKSEMSLVRDLIVREIRRATPQRDEISAAKFVRLAFHDCLKYTDGSGGCDGAINWDYMGEEVVGTNNRVQDREYLDHERKSSNNGLQHVVEFLERVYNFDFGHTFDSGCWATPATISGGAPIGDEYFLEVTSAEQCRQECLYHEGCTFFTVPQLQFLNSKGECRLFSDSGTIVHSSAGRLIAGRAECPHESWSLRSRGKSRADLWAFASLVAIEEGISRHNAACEGDRRQYGGPVMCVQFEGEEGCKIEPDRPFVFKTGRKDCISTTDEPYKSEKREAFPDEHFNGTMTVAFMEKHFGFSGKETVAIMGAHTMGRFNQKESGHKYVWTTDFYAFNNQFYRNIAGKDDWFFDDNECTKVGDAWNNKGHAIWIAKMNEVYKSGGPIQWIQKKVVCPNCAARSYDRNHNRPPERIARDRDCCLNKPEGAFCRPDGFGPQGSSVFERDNDFSEGCEYSHFIFGKDETALSSDIGLYHKFDVDLRGFPSGCPGLKTFFPSGERMSDWTCNQNIENDEWTQRGCPADCGKQDYVYPGDENTLADYVERYADNQAAWINDFIPTMEKMIENGYTDGELIVSH